MNINICKKCPNYLYFVAYQQELCIFDGVIEAKNLPMVYYVKCKNPNPLRTKNCTVYGYDKHRNKWTHTYLHQTDFFKWFRSFRINRKIKRLSAPGDCPYWIEHWIEDINKKECINGK